MWAAGSGVIRETMRLIVIFRNFKIEADGVFGFTCLLSVNLPSKSVA